jgi:hypothetical protein
MRRGHLQPICEVHESAVRLHSCHPEVAAFATEGPMHFAGSIGAANCKGPSSGKERPPQDDNASNSDKWPVKPFVRNILRVKSLESIFYGEQNLSRANKLFEINILADVIGKISSVETLLATSWPAPQTHLATARNRQQRHSKATSLRRRSEDLTSSWTTPRRRTAPATSVLRGL